MTQRYNESGYPVKKCKECKRDININSFSTIDPNLCVLCYDDNNIVKIWDITEGNYNDVYRRSTIKGTAKQVDKYCKDNIINEGYKEFDDLNTDSIGYVVYNEYNGELNAEYYIEAVESLWTDIEESKDIDLDLTNEVNN